MSIDNGEVCNFSMLGCAKIVSGHRHKFSMNIGNSEVRVCIEGWLMFAQQRH